MRRLYQEQLIFWNTELYKSAAEHSLCWGRKKEFLIHFNNKKWKPVFLDWTEEEDTAYCLAVHPDFPELLAEVKLITDELAELINEIYEADRFISGLLLFEAPAEAFANTLGSSLYTVCAAELKQHAYKFASESWDANTEAAMQVFITDNKYIVTAMNKRLMINLVTLNGSQSK